MGVHQCDANKRALVFKDVRFLSAECEERIPSNDPAETAIGIQARPTHLCIPHIVPHIRDAGQNCLITFARATVHDATRREFT